MATSLATSEQNVPVSHNASLRRELLPSAVFRTTLKKVPLDGVNQHSLNTVLLAYANNGRLVSDIDNCVFNRHFFYSGRE